MSDTDYTMGSVADLLDPRNPANFGAIGNTYDALSGFVPGALASMATLPQRAIQNSQFSLDTGTYDPSVPVEAALTTMGTGAIAGVPMKAGEAALGAGPIRAYHGSPHDFSAFDASKIGTGEGAQAYGHGLYFAENPKVAAEYRFINPAPGMGAYPASLANAAWQKAQQLGLAGGDATRAALADLQAKASRSPASAQQAIFDAMNNFETLKSGKVGHGYEVNINADPAQMLDWDRRLSQMSPQVQEAVAAAVPRNDFGRMFQSGGNDPYGWRVNQFMADAYGKGNQSAADMARGSAALSEAGIPGIKYLDAGSRGAGAGTSNYVVFDPKIVDILRKYGIVAAPIGVAAALGGLAAQDNYQQ